MSQPQDWFIFKTKSGLCQIVTEAELQQHKKSSESNNQDSEEHKWGPFTSEEEAIVRRIGLIRSGKCTPA